VPASEPGLEAGATIPLGVSGLNGLVEPVAEGGSSLRGPPRFTCL